MSHLGTRLSSFIFKTILLALVAAGPAHGHNDAKSGRKGKYGPIQCYGKGIETYGHAFVIAPKLKKNLEFKERKKLAILGGEDPVQLTHLNSLFPEVKSSYILDIKLADKSNATAFENLKSFVKTGKFPGSVKIRVATMVDQNDSKSSKQEVQSVVSELDQIDLKDYAKSIRSKWMVSDATDPTAVFLLHLKDKSVIGAIRMHDGTEECLTMESDAQRQILADGVDPKYIPEKPLFELPVKDPFIVSYFYGPRIFNSMNHSINLEQSPTSKTKSLERNPKKSLEYLNKYWQFHTGVDFSVVTGTPVYAPYDGQVFAMGKMGCAGNTLVIAHTVEGSENLVFSVYQHLMDTKNFALVVVKDDKPVRIYQPGERLDRGERTRRLQVGDPVFKGSFLAKSGASGTKIGFSKGFKQGCVGGAHLHFELRVPKESSAAAAREFAIDNKTKRLHDMGLRFRFVEVETVAINPADYIEGIQDKCRSRKEAEILNASNLYQESKKAVPPITAGLCSVRYESSLKKVPPIYRLTRQKLNVEPPAGTRATANLQ